MNTAFLCPCPFPTPLSSRWLVNDRRTTTTLPRAYSSAPYRLSPNCTAPPIEKVEPSGQSPPPQILKKTPEHKRIPYIGMLLDLFLFKRTPTDFRNKYGTVYKTDFLGQKTTYVSDLDALSEIMKNDAVFRNNGAYPPSFDMVVGTKQIPNLDGAEHKAKRRRIEKYFSPAFFRLHFECVYRSTSFMWNSVSEEVSEKGSANLFKYMKDHFLRIAVETTAEDTVELSDFEHVSALFAATSAALMSMPGTPIARKGELARMELLKLFRSIIKNIMISHVETIHAIRRERDRDVEALVRNAAISEGLNMLTYLCGMSDLPTDQHIADDDEQLGDLAETVLFTWFAGPATEASTALSMILEMGKDKEIQDRLQEEQERLIANRDGDRSLTYEIVSSEMPLLTSFMEETLRLHPAAAAIFRRVGQDTVILGHELKEGTTVVLDIWGAQRDEKYNENAR